MKPDYSKSEGNAAHQRKASTCSDSSAPDARKFRLSCDNCFLAKVKCSKERPTCSRCINLDHKCVYSPSRRAGKPRSSRNGPSAVNTTSSSPNLTSLPRSSPTTSVPDLDMLLQHRTWSLDQSDNQVMSGSSSMPDQFMPVLSNLETSNTFNASSRVDSRHNSGDSMLGAFCQPSTLPTPLDTCFDPNQLSRSSTGTTNGVAPVFPNDHFAMMGGSIPTFSNLSSSTDEFSALLSPEDIRSLSLPLGTNFDVYGAQVGSNSCNCSIALHETLSMLYSPSTSFDHLLAVNKSAINRVTLHLACTCPPDISSIMLLSVIITKIMHWYKKSRDGKGANEETMTFGTYQMDKEDEQRIKMALVKSELRKVEMLLSRFRERFERSLSGSDKQVYEANMTFLERRLHDTFKGL